MKAIRTHAVGGPETLTLDEVETPTPGKGEVLVAVKACAITPSTYSRTCALPMCGCAMAWIWVLRSRRAPRAA